jgi:transposase, IS5 family
MVRCRMGQRFLSQPARHEARISGSSRASQSEPPAGLTLRAPDHAAPAFDEERKKAGTAEVCFSKPAGVPVDEMTTTSRIRRTLKRFRAGIEAGISFLKRSFGWRRVTWSGWKHFCAYVWCSTVSHNLLTFARALLSRKRPQPA